jgi:hypothetical protein
MKKVASLLILLAAILIMAAPGLIGTAEAATNTAYTFENTSDPVNPQYTEFFFAYTQSSASPEAFSVAMPEPTIRYGLWDTFTFYFETSTGAGEWAVGTAYTYVDTDSDNIRDSLQATLSGADSESAVYVYARDNY